MTTDLFHDTTVLLKRSLRHILRSPDTIITTAVTPIAMLLLFVYVFGSAIDTGGGSYVNYLPADLQNRASSLRLRGTTSVNCF